MRIAKASGGRNGELEKPFAGGGLSLKCLVMNVEPRFLTGEGPQIFTGNEALLKGALETEGGVHYLGGYPGGPKKASKW